MGSSRRSSRGHSWDRDRAGQEPGGDPSVPVHLSQPFGTTYISATGGMSLECKETHSRDLVEIIENRFASHNFEHWAARLDQQKCIWAPVQTLDEVVDDPQVHANGYTTMLTHAEAGDFQILTAPMKYGRTDGVPASTAPELGQHTETALLELGYDWDEIIALKEQGAII